MSKIELGRVVEPSPLIPNSNRVGHQCCSRETRSVDIQVKRHELQRLSRYVRNRNLQKPQAISVRDFEEFYPHPTRHFKSCPDKEKGPNISTAGSVARRGATGRVREGRDYNDYWQEDDYLGEERDGFDDTHNDDKRELTISLLEIARPAKRKGKLRRPLNTSTTVSSNVLVTIGSEIDDEDWEDIDGDEEEAWEEILRAEILQGPRKSYAEVLKA
ncbi:hypothetical protein K435DRAFT_861726 [Dendrothele bispora CBS 962.96]|uniref:Uncharacterized protein n=1 Tax=Dendrothele bispora (strain CBS 962.96) TaxID=1314807 RepID=A0A4S8LUE1_DENBC|nr:hypothetical protein K435DRAFT_861726 [Dendrothele bispora CBS 962.96]